MPIARSTLAAAGTAVLLVLAAFTAGSASMSQPPLQTSDRATQATTYDDSAEALRDELADDVTVNAITPWAEMLYVPVAPCRVVNTRNTDAGAMGSTSRSIDISGTLGERHPSGATPWCSNP